MVLDVNQLAATVGTVGTIAIILIILLALWIRSRILVWHKRDMQSLEIQHQRELKRLALQEQRAAADLAEEAVDVETLHTLNISVVNLNERIQRLREQKEAEKLRADNNWNDLQDARRELAELRANKPEGGGQDEGQLPTNYDEMVRLTEENAQLKLDLDKAQAQNLVLTSDLQRVNDYIASLGENGVHDVLPELRHEEE